MEIFYNFSIDVKEKGMVNYVMVFGNKEVIKDI